MIKLFFKSELVVLYDYISFVDFKFFFFIKMCIVSFVVVINLEIYTKGKLHVGHLFCTLWK